MSYFWATPTPGFLAPKAGRILKREKAPWLQALLNVLCLLPPVSHMTQFMPLCYAIDQTGGPDSPLPAFLNGLQFK